MQFTVANKNELKIDAFYSILRILILYKKYHVDNSHLFCGIYCIHLPIAPIEHKRIL